MSKPSEAADPIIRKMIVVAILIVGLLVPLGWTGNLVVERQTRHQDVKRELSATWGGEQMLQGPLLVVPFVERRTNDEGEETIRYHRAYFLPDTLEIDGTIEPETRSRGIFRVLLYRVRLRVTGTFAPPAFGPRPVDAADVAWNEAVFSIGIPDLRGVESDPELEWNGAPVRFRPGAGPVEIYASGMNALVPGVAARADTPYRFSFALTLTGADALRFVPAGKDNRLSLSSVWPDPSFTGAFLPVERSVDADGFTADWRVSYYARSYPQSWRSDDGANAPRPEAWLGSAFGVRLLESVDFYRKTERATKYAVLFLSLTFLAFLLFEALNRLRVHPLPYLLVGLALCLFFVLLLSLSEHVGFAAAYASAAGATIVAITAYASRLLAGIGRAGLLGVGLTILYGWLYVLLQLEDYALLLGSLGLFATLAGVMYVTRNVDWYAPGNAQTEQAT